MGLCPRSARAEETPAAPGVRSRVFVFVLDGTETCFCRDKICRLFRPALAEVFLMARKVGQIIRRETGTWLVRVYSGRDPETKRRKYLNQTIHGGLRDAQAHLNKMLSERDLGRKLDSSKQTLNQHLDYWLELCAKPRLRAKSLKDYEGLLRRYVRPRLGPKALASISSLDIQALYRDLLVRNLSARSIRYTHAVLRSALKQAMRWNFILANPADSVDLPRQERPQIEVLTVEQARIFVKALAGHQYSDLFAIALTTGMLPSEYLGLTWNDLDLERGTASVRGRGDRKSTRLNSSHLG